MKQKRGLHVKRRKYSLYPKRKSKGRVFLEIALTVILVSALGVGGFLAAKVIQRFVIEDEQGVDDQELVWSPPPDLEDIVPSEEPADNSDSVGTTSPESKDKPEKQTLGGMGLLLPSSVLSNRTSLTSYALQAKQSGYDYAVAELKSADGSLWYLTNSKYAKGTQLVKSTMPLDEIRAAIEESGLVAVAAISTLKDSGAGRDVDDTCYRFESEDSNWLDDTAANGGKLWNDPFRDGTKAYLADITAEVTAAGFKHVVLTGLQYPEFIPYDYKVLRPEIADKAKRAAALTEVCKSIKAAANGADIYIEMSAADAANPALPDTAEILSRRDKSLEIAALLLKFQNNGSAEEVSISGGGTFALPNGTKERVEAYFKAAKKNAAGYTLLAAVNHTQFTNAELASFAEAAKSLGLNGFLME
ncbi:MAG: hypothetical protein LBN40_02650 [Oscillospiraceae bacterium]|jgi:hypothetical protein|nr:hypothetical protein [Oscillospiraceae bacterium]